MGNLSFQQKKVEPEIIIIKPEGESDSDLTDDDEEHKEDIEKFQSQEESGKADKVVGFFKRKKKRPPVTVYDLDLTIFGYEGKYDGQMNKRTGLADGVGYWKRNGGGEWFKGEFVKGKVGGHGKFVFNDGSYYDGEWLEGQKHGMGKEKIVRESSNAWDGEDHLFNDEYEGQFDHGKRHGQGKQTFANGDIYDGMWFKNKKHGNGKFIFKLGGEYEGKYMNNERNGEGKLTYKDGGSYVGNFEDGKQKGRGIETRADGTIYHDGYWLNGLPQVGADLQALIDDAMYQHSLDTAAAEEEQRKLDIATAKKNKKKKNKTRTNSSDDEDDDDEEDDEEEEGNRSPSPISTKTINNKTGINGPKNEMELLQDMLKSEEMNRIIYPIPQVEPHGRSEPEIPKPWSKPAI